MKVNVSNGELVDKVTILLLKLDHMQSAEKRRHVQKELDALKPHMESLGISRASVVFRELLDVNSRLWDIEDKIRIKEAREEFDGEFIELARSVYHENDRRAELKRRINVATSSDLFEEKQYAPY